MRLPVREGKRASLPGISVLILLGTFVGISGCGSITSQTDGLSESILPQSQDTGALVKNLAQRIHQSRTLRSLAAVNYWGKDGRGGFQEAILVHRPDRLRLETLSPLGAILIVTVNADAIAGFHTREGLFYRGKSSKENIFRYTHIPLELGELTSLLMGLPPVEAHGRWEGEANSIHRTLGGGGREVIAFHPALGVPTKWERFGADGEVELGAIFADFASTPAGPFPLKITLEAPAQEIRLEIHYQEPELNIELPLPFFVQERPGSAREVPLESLGG